MTSCERRHIETSGINKSAFWCSTGGINQDKTLYNNLYQHQSKALVESILDGSHRGKAVLISWEHKVEVDIAHHLGIPVKGEGALCGESAVFVKIRYGKEFRCMDWWKVCSLET
jgi:hypothetical protein